MKKKKLELPNDAPKCDNCQEHLSERTIYIIDAPCYSCNREMKVALGKNYTTFGPDKFNNDELEYAKSKDAFIKENYSNTVKESYLSNTCPDCNKFIGGFYLFTEYFVPAQNNEYKYETLKSGYNCQKCDFGK